MFIWSFGPETPTREPWDPGSYGRNPVSDSSAKRLHEHIVSISSFSRTSILNA